VAGALAGALRSYKNAGRTVEESCRVARAPEDLASFARAGLLPPDRVEQLFAHQELALSEAMKGRNVVITAARARAKRRHSSCPCWRHSFASRPGGALVKAARARVVEGRNELCSQRINEEGATRRFALSFCIR